MAAYIVIAVAFAIGFVLRLRGWRWWAAFFASCLAVPVFIVVLVLMKLDGWEWWPVAITFGSLYGAASGALGVLAATVTRKARHPKNPSPESGRGA